MHFLHNNKRPTSAALRSLLTVVFVIWLANVMFQYNDNKVEHDPKNNHKQAPSNIVIEQLTLPPVPKTSAKIQTSTQSPSSEQRPEANIEKGTQPASANQQQVQQVYEQLSDHTIDIQIAWPQQAHQQQTTLDFMYQCASMQFAVLNGNNITKVNQSRVIDYSDWIRVAQGNLSKKEQHWLTAYALSGTPIRLFPREIDLRLSQHIANTLKGSKLKTLRAHYQVSNQTLFLNDIQLNGQPIKGSWPLYRGKCN